MSSQCSYDTIGSVLKGAHPDMVSALWKICHGREALPDTAKGALMIEAHIFQKLKIAEDVQTLVLSRTRNNTRPLFAENESRDIVKNANAWCTRNAVRLVFSGSSGAATMERTAALTAHALRRLAAIEGLELLAAQQTGEVAFGLRQQPAAAVAAVLDAQFGIRVQHGALPDRVRLHLGPAQHLRRHRCPRRCAAEGRVRRVRGRVHPRRRQRRLRGTGRAAGWRIPCRIAQSALRRSAAPAMPHLVTFCTADNVLAGSFTRPTPDACGGV